MNLIAIYKVIRNIILVLFLSLYSEFIKLLQKWKYI